MFGLKFKERNVLKLILYKSDDSERGFMVTKLFVTITFLLSSLHSYIYIITRMPKRKSLDPLLWRFISMLYCLAKYDI